MADTYVYLANEWVSEWINEKCDKSKLSYLANYSYCKNNTKDYFYLSP